MEKQVLITVDSRISSFDGDRDHMSFVTEGKLIREDGSYVITYEESEITGLEGTTTTLKVEKDSVTLMRHGNVDSMMLFEVGKTHLTDYDTRFGSVILGITAKSVDIDFNDSGGTIKIDYILEYNRSYGGSNCLLVKVFEKNTKA